MRKHASWWVVVLVALSGLCTLDASASTSSSSMPHDDYYETLVSVYGTTSKMVSARNEVICVPAYTSGIKWSEISGGGWFWRFLEAPFLTRVVAVRDGAATRTLHYGANPNDVHHEAWSTNEWLRQWTGGVARFSPHEQQCFNFPGKRTLTVHDSSPPSPGGEGSKKQYCSLEVTQVVDTMALLQVLGAFLLAFVAPKFVKYNIFIYALAFLLGMTVAMIIILYFILRRISSTQNFVAISTVAFGAQTAFIWYFKLFLQQYLHATLFFFLISGFFGFAMIYRYELTLRERRLLSWALQIAGITAAWFAFPRSIAEFPDSVSIDPTSAMAAAAVAIFPTIIRAAWNAKAKKRDARKQKAAAAAAAAAAATTATANGGNGFHHHNNNHSSADGEDDMAEQATEEEVETSDDEEETERERLERIARGDDPDVFDGIGMAADRSGARRNRSLLHRFLTKKMGDSGASPFIVRGAGPYMSIDDYEAASRRATEAAEKQLLEDFQKHAQKYSAVLSPWARQKMRQRMGQSAE